MKKLHLTTKVSVISIVFIIIYITSLGFYFDTFLRDDYFNNSKNKIVYAKNKIHSEFKDTQNELKKSIEFVKTDADLIASIELINNYQDKQEYNAVLLDEEKKDITKKLLDNVKVSFNSFISLYDKNQELISFVYLDEKGYKLNFISYNNSKIILNSRYEHEQSYSKSNYTENNMVSFMHVNYYSIPDIKKRVLITQHHVDNKVIITSHNSVYDKYDITKMIMHIEMSKIFNSLYFKTISNNLNIHISLSDDIKYENLSLPFYSNLPIKDENIKDNSSDYFSSFFVQLKNRKVYIVFSLDKFALKSSLDENRKRLILFLIGSVLLMIIIIRFLMLHGLKRPLDALMEQIDKVRSGDYSKNDILKTSDELEIISENISKLAEAVQSREQRLKYLSTHDELTGLLNRRKFIDILDKTIQAAKKNGTHLAILFLDLDQFKHVNDTLGHSIGDNLLKSVANRLKTSLSDGDDIARVGGDEFNISVKGFKNLGELRIIAQNVLDEFEEPFVDFQNEIITSTSIGIAIYPDDGLDSETLIKNADLAMYMSKDRGRNNYSFYASDFSKSLEKRAEIVQGLKSAIKNQNEFELYYQPKISIKTQKIVGVEALIRWNSPTLGFVRPDQFISIAEETHLIIDIGKWIIQRACKDFILLEKNAYMLDQISVNISGVQLQYGDMLNTVKDILSLTGMPAEKLELEVTESYIATNEQKAVDVLSEFRNMGIELAIDDFGTGYSSMSYLQKLPITRLKIDKAFVDDLPESTQSVAVVKAIIALAETFKLKITVEGIELEKQLDFFKDKYCNDIQGYLYSKPLILDDLKEFISNNS